MAAFVSAALGFVGVALGSLSTAALEIASVLDQWGANGALMQHPRYMQDAFYFVSAFIGTLSFAFAMPVIFKFFFGPPPELETRVPFPVVGSDYNTDTNRLDSVARIQCSNPATGQKLGTVPHMSAPDVYQRVARARAAQRKWRLSSFSERKAVMEALQAYIMIYVDSLVEMSCDDTGKTKVDAMLGEILTTLEKLKWIIRYGEEILSTERRPTGILAMHKHAELQFSPLGVIGAIQPWNYPMHNLFNPVIAALFAGNACVVKVSEHSSWSSIYFADVIRENLQAMGHCPDLVQVITGTAEAGEALVDSVDKVFFTGSTAIGKLVALKAAQRLTPVVLELGGKDPFIICDDADLNQASDLLMRGVFQNAGQNCIGVERVFVQGSVEAKLIEKVLPVVKKLRQGTRDDDIAAMTMGEPAISNIEQLVSDAVKSGAKLLCGGKRNTEIPGGFFFQPTVLTGVTTTMAIAREEVFGPVMAILTFETDVKLVKMINDCAFGLGSSVFSSDRRRAELIGRSLRVGMTNLNDFGINYLCQSLPFGGTKDSGSDRFAGIEGLRGCCLMKAVTRDRIPFIKTNLPTALKYPIAPNGYAFLVEMHKLVFEHGVFSKAENLYRMARMLVNPGYVPVRRLY